MAKEKDDIDSDTEKLSKAFATCVIITENKEAEEAEFSVYSWIADSGVMTHTVYVRIRAHSVIILQFLKRKYKDWEINL